jgi:hypothetical protein
LKPAVWPLTEAEYDVLELALPLSIEEALKEPPRGDEDVEDALACDWICGRLGRRSLDTAGFAE